MAAAGTSVIMGEDVDHHHCKNAVSERTVLLPIKDVESGRDGSDAPLESSRSNRFRGHLSFKKFVDPTWKQRAKKEISCGVLLLYAASSFGYSALGITMLAKVSTLQRVFGFYYLWLVFGGYLIAQGFVTFFSDVQYVDQLSVWHPADRCFVMVGAPLVTINYGLIMSVSSAVSENVIGVSVYTCGFVLSCVSFAYELPCKKNQRLQAFLLAHAGWHFFGPATFIFFILALH